MNKSFEQKVIDQIRTYNMIEAGDYIIIGVSGGRDSVCLLHVLHMLSKEWGFNLYVVHVNHMLRGDESERDKKFVKDICRKRHISCMTVNADIMAIASAKGMSLEEAGRETRYKAFANAAHKITVKDEYAHIKVAVAHHRDDNVETILLNLSRGSGLKGIQGMMPVSTKNDMTIIRPFLNVGRDEIEKYIAANDLAYVDDSTNFSDDYARNKIRLKVIPELQKVNTKVSQHISDTASNLALIQEYMEKQVSAAMYGVVDERDDSIAIDTDNFKDLDPAIQTEIIYKCIGKMAGSLKDITRVHVNDVISLTDKQTGRRIELPYSLTALKSYGNIIIRKNENDTDSIRRDYDATPVHMILDSHLDISLREIENGGKTFMTSDGGQLVFKLVDVNDENRSQLVEKNIYNKAFDYDTIKGSLILGRPQPDDEIKFAGGTKSLKKYFTDEKIPAQIRKQMLVLKDVNGTLWVLGYRIGEPYKITERTTRALVVSIIGGNDEQS